jgi:hypothetical protein
MTIRLDKGSTQSIPLVGVSSSHFEREKAK